jgi:hypothetical protein
MDAMVKPWHDDRERCCAIDLRRRGVHERIQ